MKKDTLGESTHLRLEPEMLDWLQSIAPTDDRRGGISIVIRRALEVYRQLLDEQTLDREPNEQS